MEENKKEEIVIEKDYYTKLEIEELLNKKITDTFGEILKELNKPKEEPKEEKEKTLNDYLF